MNRGEIWKVDLGLKAGIRPVVILTRGKAIPYLNKLTVAEITSRKKGYPTEVDVNQRANLTIPSVVQLDSLHTIPKGRFKKYIGTLNKSDLRAINGKVIFALDLLNPQ